MVGNLTFECKGKTVDLPVGALDIARLVAYQRGFKDVDCEPVDLSYKITASGPNRSVTGKGRTQSEAAMKLVELMW